MAQDRIQGSKVPHWADRDKTAGVKLDTSVYVGVVKNNVDAIRSGRLQVWIPDFGATQTEATNENDPVFWRTVSYAPPFFGTTYQPIESSTNSFENNKQTYGMWFVPPDVGVEVLCAFVNGDPNRGYWFACVPSVLSHTMVPAVGTAPGANTQIVSDDIRPSILGDFVVPRQTLPVGEFNENEPGTYNSTFFENSKPIHEFQANILFKQGLDRDKIRGAITSSSQRESPSRVFGISTPGRPLGNDPADDPDFLNKLANGEINEVDYAVRARKGGHTLVMDDGDLVGNDQLIRLRTAGGHQILMNDTEKVLYIANSSGSAWVEFTDSGHMMFYNSGGFHVHSEGDVNFHSGGSINLQAERSVNISAPNEINVAASKVNVSGSTSTYIFGGRLDIGSDAATTIGAGKIVIGSEGAVEIDGATIDLNSKSPKNNMQPGSIRKFKHSDVGYDEEHRLWVEIPDAASSIVTVLPQHEPWSRNSSAFNIQGEAPFKEVVPPVCEPLPMERAADYQLPPANGKFIDHGKFRGQPMPWSTDVEFIEKVKSVAAAINSNYIDLLACMNLESARTFDPWIQNSLGYTGLIQFGKAAATDLKTTTAYLRNLTRVEQCDWVLKYFKMWQTRTGVSSFRLVDMYLAILWPAAVGKPGNYVVFPAGSNEYKQNHGFDPGRRVGYITVDMIANSISSHLEEVKQALANAAEVLGTNNVIVDGSSVPITDGSGNVISSTVDSHNVEDDLGIRAAAGSEVSNSCPVEWMYKETAYNPPGGIGSGNPSLNEIQAKAMIAELGYMESMWDYKKQSTDNNGNILIGKFMIDAEYLVNKGYIKKDALSQYGNTTLLNGESWTGKENINKIETFKDFGTIQDTIQYEEFVNNYDELVAKDGIKETDSICVAAGMLFVAHQFRSVDLAIEWRKKGGMSDSRGVPGEVYFNHGRYAIDVLASSVGVPVGESKGDGSGKGVYDGFYGENTTGIDPSDVFIFSSSGTGTRERFEQLRGEFKDAILMAAKEYKEKTGNKVRVTSAFRSQADQDLLYQRWLDAGGGPNKPKAGGIITPAKVSNHSQGIAIDTSEGAHINRTIDLAKYGLLWGGIWRKPDPVHIQLKNVPNPEK